MLKHIMNIGTKEMPSGKRESFALFLCESCGHEVERVLTAARRNLTCGCRVKAPPKETKRFCMRCATPYNQKSHGKITETSRVYCPKCFKYLRYFKRDKEIYRYAKLNIPK